MILTRAIITILCLVLCFPLLCHSQTCEVFAGNPLLCTSVFESSNLVFVPSGQAQVTVAAFSAIPYFIEILATASPRCALSAISFFCSSLFPTCVENATSAVARQTCRSDCLSVYSDCATEIAEFGAITSVGSLLPNCSLLPENSYNATVDGDSREVSCFHPLIDPLWLNATCPDGLVRTDQGDEEGYCWFKCPLMLYSKHELDALKITMSVLSIISFFGYVSLLICTFYRYSSSAFRWPRGIPFYFGCFGIILHISFWIGMFGGYEDVWCEKGNFATQKETPCAVQAAIFTIGFYGSGIWSFWLSLNLVLSFTIPKLIRPIYLEITAHITAIGLPLMAVIAGLVRNQAGFPGDIIICSVLGSGFKFYIYPLAALVSASGLGLLLAVAWISWQAIHAGYQPEKSLREQVQVMRRHLAKVLKAQWRLLVLACYTCFFLGFSVGVFLFQENHQTEIATRVGNQYICLALGGGSECDGDLYVPYGVLFTAILGIFTIGIVYGIVTFEPGLFKAILKCKWKAVSSSRSTELYKDESLDIEYD